MNCEEADEMIGAYALGALPPDEAAAVAAHLRTCERHRVMASELGVAAASLASLADPVAPPAALRARLLAAVAETPQAGAEPRHLHASRTQRAGEGSGARTGSGAQQAPPLQDAWSERPRSSAGRWRVPPAWGALAAAVIVAVGGLVAWNVVLMNRLDDREDDARFAVTRATSVSPLQAHDAAGGGTVLYFEAEKKAVVVAEGMPAPDSEHTYQMWAIADGQPVSIGLMAPDEAGGGTVVVDFDASRAQTFAITLEPLGGSEQPTTSPLYTAGL